MIPLSLTLKGIYSYQKEQTIDFTVLTDAGIFGLFGTVGSGKSTILEAISFALYNDTERLNKQDNRNYNMMNLKSDELLIDFTFRTGKENKEYRFRVNGKRNRKRFDDVKTFERSAYIKEDGNWQPLEQTTAEEVIGLSYDNFRRTVIIPQGKFQEFLQLGDKDRTEMMKKLFHLEKYDLYDKTAHLENRNNLDKGNIEAQLSQLGESQPELIQEKEKELAGLQLQNEQVKVKMQQKQQDESALQQLKKLFEKIALQKNALDQLQLQKDSYNQREIIVKQYQNCLLNFKSLFDRKTELNANLEKNAQSIAQKNENLEQVQKKFDEAAQQFSLVKTEFDQKDQLVQQAADLENIASIINYSAEKRKAEERQTNGIQVITKTEKDIAEYQLKLKNKNQEIQENKKKLPDSSVLVAVKQWFTIHKNQKEAIIQREKDLEETNKKLEEFTTSKEKLIRESGITGIRPQDSTDKLTVQLKSLQENFQKEIQDIDLQIEHLNVQDKLETFAKELTEGNPCPLCGAIHHPHVWNAQNISHELAKVRQTRKEKDESVKKILSVLQQMGAIAAKIEVSYAQQASCMKRLEDEKEKLNKHLSSFSWKEYTPESEQKVNADLSESERLQKLINQDEDTYAALSKELDAKLNKKDQYKEALDKIRQEITSSTSAISTLQGQLKLLKIEDYRNYPLEKITAKSGAIRAKVKSNEERYKKLNDELVQLGQKREKLKGELQTEKTNQEMILQQAGILNDEITKKLATDGYQTIEEVEDILKKPLELEQEREAINRFRQELFNAEEQYKNSLKEAEGKRYDLKAHEELLQELKILNEEIGKKNQKIGSLTNEIKQLNENLTKSAQLKKDLQKLEARAENLRTMKLLFKGNGFVNYVSSVYLQNLCSEANKRFSKLTGGKLNLELTDTNNFQIRDIMNEGKLRSVKTLSGGQTFQAALSLALALADNIRQITESSQNFFFLDEGFGSLDKDSLNVVFETLKSLRKERRIVGVISHVEEMQQEIDTHLKIVNDPDLGSIINPSWRN